jgi:hypothetical protein
MMIIEGMKKIKDLQQKAADLREKVKAHGADLDIQEPVYENQKDKVEGWIQAHTDLMKEIVDLRVRIMRTNIATYVTVRLGDKDVIKSIAEWVVRRGNKREPGLWQHDYQLWAGLTEQAIAQRGLKDGQLTLVPGTQPVAVKLRRYFDVNVRDAALDLYRSEANVIDAALEVANATTELLSSPEVKLDDVNKTLE